MFSQNRRAFRYPGLLLRPSALPEIQFLVLITGPPSGSPCASVSISLSLNRHSRGLRGEDSLEVVEQGRCGVADFVVMGNNDTQTERMVNGIVGSVEINRENVISYLYVVLRLSM